MATNETKNTVTGYNEARTGNAYAYDTFRTYDDENIFYDQIGETPTPVNETKNSVTGTNQAKS